MPIGPGRRDVLVVERIADEKIREILAHIFKTDKDRIAVFPSENIPEHSADSADIFCFTRTLKGDAPLMLDIAGYWFSDDEALMRLVGGFMKFKVACYIDKDNFDDFYHVDASGNLVIAREVYEDDYANADVHRFVVTGPYDGSLGEEFETTLWDRAALCSSFPFGLE